MTFSTTLTRNELLYILVLYGVDDEDKFKELGLDIEETTRENLENGKQSLLSREMLKTETSGSSYIQDDSLALVAITLSGEKVDNEYVDEESGLKVRFLKEGNMYLFKGYI